MVRLVTAQRAADAVRLEWPEVVITAVAAGTRDGPGPNGGRAHGGAAKGECTRGPGHSAAPAGVFPAFLPRGQGLAAGPRTGLWDVDAVRPLRLSRTGL